MSFYQVTPRSEEDYRQLICEVMSELNLNAEQFAGMVIRYSEPDPNGDRKIHVHKNSVYNWISGNSIPRDMETFVSIALLKVRGTLNRTNQTKKERDFILQEVQRLFIIYMNEDFNPWFLPHAVMIEAIRGIYAMDEVPAAVDYLKQKVKPRGLQINDEKAASGVTGSILEDLMNVESPFDMDGFVDRWKDWLAFGYGVIGRRMQKRFEERARAEYRIAPGFYKMISLYAPNQRNTYQKLFDQDSRFSRVWLIDFCIHMRFEREEINKVLSAARVGRLSDEKTNPESTIKDYKNASVGSVKWYLHPKGGTYTKSCGGRYRGSDGYGEQEKLSLLLLLGVFLEQKWLEYDADDDEWMKKTELCRVKETIPVDYFLEYIPNLPAGRDLIRDVWKDLNRYNVGQEGLDGAMKESWAERLYTLLEIPQSGIPDLNDTEKMLYRDYREEFQSYYMIPDFRKTEHAVEEVAAMHLYAAMMYSVCTGDLYEAKALSAETLSEIVNTAFPSIDINLRTRLSNFMVLMLGKKSIRAADDSGILIKNKYGGETLWNMKKFTDVFAMRLQNR